MRFALLTPLLKLRGKPPKTQTPFPEFRGGNFQKKIDSFIRQKIKTEKAENNRKSRKLYQLLCSLDLFAVSQRAFTLYRGGSKIIYFWLPNAFCAIDSPAKVARKTPKNPDPLPRI